MTKLDEKTMVKVLHLLLKEWCADPVDAINILHDVADKITGVDNES